MEGKNQNTPRNAKNIQQEVPSKRTEHEEAIYHFKFFLENSVGKSKYKSGTSGKELHYFTFLEYLPFQIVLRGAYLAKIVNGLIYFPLKN